MGSSEPKLRLNAIPKRVKEAAREIAIVTPPIQRPATVPFEWEEAPGKPRPSTANMVPKSKAVRRLQLPPANRQPSPTSVLDDPMDHQYPIPSNTLSLSRSRSLTFSGFEKKGRKKKDTESSDPKVKITRISRKSSFVSFSSSTSYFLSNIYESCKQVLTWRPRNKN